MHPGSPPTLGQQIPAPLHKVPRSQEDGGQDEGGQQGTPVDSL